MTEIKQRKSTSIVRIKITKTWTPNPNDNHYNFELMQFQDYVFQKDFYHKSIRTLEICPYKWYEFQYLWEYPSYWLLSSLSLALDMESIRQNTKIINIVRSIFIAIDAIVTIVSFMALFN